MAELLLATRNEGKIREIQQALRKAHPALLVRSLREVADVPVADETGSSFLENARAKASLAATFAKVPALADDSGLEVDALGGRPGVLSARFAGPQATDRENIEKLLAKLRGVPASRRGARFRCAMVLCSPAGATFTAVEELRGEILEVPRGSGGFGYDPVFFLPGLNRALAELTLGEKNRLSHRAKALAKVSAALADFLGKA